MTQAEYLSLHDFTGRKIRADKRGMIHGSAPDILRQLGCQPERWTGQVMATGRGFNRAIGDVESLTEKAKAMGQHWLRGIGVARRLAAATA